MAARVTIGKQRTTYVNGRPFFLIGARHMPVGATLEILAEAGFNGFRHLVFGNEGQDPEIIDDDTSGLYFWAYIYNRADFSQSPSHESDLKEAVRRLKEHPHLLCYENLNEPTLRYKSDCIKCEPDILKEGTKLVRSLDPDHPIWMVHCCHNTVETVRQYNDSLDIIGCNPYPIYVPGMRVHIGVRADGKMLDCIDQSIHAVGKYTNKMMSAGKGRPVWMLIQAMANEYWYNSNHTPEYAEQGIDPSKVLYPAYEEMRFMAYDSIVSGATGIAFAMHGTKASGKVWEDIKRLVTELHRLHDVLCSPTIAGEIHIAYNDLGFTIWDGVRTLAKRYGRHIYIFAANTAFDPADVSITLPFSVGNCACVEQEDREIPVTGGILQDCFQPYGVHVYRLTAED